MVCHILRLPALQIFACEDGVLLPNKELTPKERGENKPQIYSNSCAICRVQLLVWEKFREQTS